MQRTEKPWGAEFLWALTEGYAGKVLAIKKGHSLSLQYHEKKEETLLIHSGRVKIEWFDVGGEWTEALPKIEVFVPGDVFHVPPGRRHRIEAIDDANVIEVSTPELDDVIRLKDLYGRA